MKIARHEPEWKPALLPVDAAGNTKPGFICVHELENGNGQCAGNVFALDQAVGDHCCMVSDRQMDAGTGEAPGGTRPRSEHPHDYGDYSEVQ